MPYLDLIRAEPPALPDEETKKPPAAAATGTEVVDRAMQEAEAVAAAAWMRQMRAELAPVRHQPPADCIAQAACSRLGPCDRQVDGRPCLVASLGSERSSAGGPDSSTE